MYKRLIKNSVVRTCCYRLPCTNFNEIRVKVILFRSIVSRRSAGKISNLEAILSSSCRNRLYSDHSDIHLLPNNHNQRRSKNKRSLTTWNIASLCCKQMNHFVMGIHILKSALTDSVVCSLSCKIVKQ